MSVNGRSNDSRFGRDDGIKIDRVTVSEFIKIMALDQDSEVDQPSRLDKYLHVLEYTAAQAPKLEIVSQLTDMLLAIDSEPLNDVIQNIEFANLTFLFMNTLLDQTLSNIKELKFNQHDVERSQIEMDDKEVTVQHCILFSTLNSDQVIIGKVTKSGKLYGKVVYFQNSRGSNYLKVCYLKNGKQHGTSYVKIWKEFLKESISDCEVLFLNGFDQDAACQGYKAKKNQTNKIKYDESKTMKIYTRHQTYCSDMRMKFVEGSNLELERFLPDHASFMYKREYSCFNYNTKQGSYSMIEGANKNFFLTSIAKMKDDYKSTIRKYDSGM